MEEKIKNLALEYFFASKRWMQYSEEGKFDGITSEKAKMNVLSEEIEELQEKLKNSKKAQKRQKNSK